MQKELITKQLPFTNKKTAKFCESKNLLSGIAAYHKLVLRVFKNANSIKIRLHRDPEITEYYYVSFDVIVKDDVDSVLEKIESFERLKAVRKLAPKEPNIHFVLMPTIKNAKTTFIMANNA